MLLQVVKKWNVFTNSPKADDWWEQKNEKWYKNMCLWECVCVCVSEWVSVWLKVGSSLNTGQFQGLEQKLTNTTVYIIANWVRKRYCTSTFQTCECTLKIKMGKKLKMNEIEWRLKGKKRLVMWWEQNSLCVLRKKVWSCFDDEQFGIECMFVWEWVFAV